VKRKLPAQIMSVVVLLSLVLSACQAAGLPATALQPVGAFIPLKVDARNCDYGGEFKTIEAIDEFTVRFSLCNPDPTLLQKVALPVFSIQDKDVLDATKGKSNQLSLSTNGTGPYIISEYVPERRIVLQNNPSYWGVPGKSREIIFQWDYDSMQRYNLVRTSEVDGAEKPPFETIETIRSGKGLQLMLRPPQNVLFLGFNNTIAPFNNARFRQGVAWALNRTQLVNNFYSIGSRTAEQLVPLSVKPGFTDSIPWYPQDVTSGTQLIARSGHNMAEEILLTYRNVSEPYMPKPNDVALDIKLQLVAMGLNVRLNPLTTDEFNVVMAEGKAGMFLFGFVPVYPDASNYYNTQFIGPGKIKFGTPYPDLEAAIRTAGQATNTQARQASYDTANSLIKRYIPLIPLANGVDGLVFAETVQNVVVGPLNENFPEMSTVNDRIVFAQSNAPVSLWPGDETDIGTLRLASLLYTPLLRFKYGSGDITGGLAEYWESNTLQTEYTFYLRRDVSFTNGSKLDANDVVATFAAQWDAANPNHTGRTGSFEYFEAIFGSFLNKK
jgi:peptide/nickel transport system substrate-binding protein